MGIDCLECALILWGNVRHHRNDCIKDTLTLLMAEIMSFAQSKSYDSSLKVYKCFLSVGAVIDTIVWN